MSGVEGRCGLCGQPWSQECIELSCEPPSVPTEQADGGVVGDDPCPKRGETRVINGSWCRFIERELEGDKWEILGPAVATPPATPIAGGFGSSSPKSEDTQPGSADRWADLERLAKAATPGEWESGEAGDVGLAGTDWGVVYPPRRGTIASLNDGEYIENPNATADAAFIAAANPATILELIDAARRDEEAGQ